MRTGSKDVINKKPANRRVFEQLLSHGLVDQIRNAYRYDSPLQQ